jgi:hypothetical protein
MRKPGQEDPGRPLIKQARPDYDFGMMTVSMM